MPVMQKKMVGYWAGGVALLMFCSTVAASGVTQWASIKEVSPGPAKVIGAVSNGCLGGAEVLPETGTGYVSIRRHRNRYYGHPETLKLVEHVGQVLAKQTDKLMMVGDLSQPRGGRMSSMHRSHQNGLDVDVWFKLASSSDSARKSTPEEQDPPSMLGPDKRTVNGEWGDFQALLIKTAAQHPKVDRIFVNPAIKLALCSTEKGNREWLAKLRPWWGHDAHFHVRLKCPAGSPNCKTQPAITVGDGCGKELSFWFKPRPKQVVKKQKVEIKPKAPAKKRSPPPMPTECQPLLTG